MEVNEQEKILPDEESSKSFKDAINRTMESYQRVEDIFTMKIDAFKKAEIEINRFIENGDQGKARDTAKLVADNLLHCAQLEYAIKVHLDLADKLLNLKKNINWGISEYYEAITINIANGQIDQAITLIENIFSKIEKGNDDKMKQEIRKHLEILKRPESQVTNLQDLKNEFQNNNNFLVNNDFAKRCELGIGIYIKKDINEHCVKQ